MKTQDDIRKLIVDKLKERKISLNAASNMIGMNSAYLYKFVHYNVPDRLNEMARKKLSALLGIGEEELTTDAELFEPPLITMAAALYDKLSETAKKLTTTDTVRIDIIDAAACCGSGLENFSENRIGSLSIPLQEFKEITNVSPTNVKLIRAAGDSMEPTINDGDRVWVDTSNNFVSSDGIYLIRIASSIVIKRIQIGPSGITVKSDNARYGDFPLQDGCQIIGKVIYIWNGRRV